MIDRSTYLGSHAASAVLGRNPFSSKTDIYQQVLGIAKQKPPTDGMLIGLDLEPIVLKWYEKKAGFKVVRQQELVTHPRISFIKGHVDGIVEGDPSHGVDAKVGNPFFMREWGSEDNQIPEAYYLQAQHFMLITGFPRWDIFLMCGTHMKNYPIQANQEIQNLIEKTLVESWAEIENLRVMREKEPEAFTARMFEIAGQDEEAKANIVHATWPHATDGDIGVPSEHYGLFERLIEVNQNYEAEKGNREQLINEVKAAMKGTARWRGQGGEVAWVGKDVRKFYIRPAKEFKA